MVGEPGQWVTEIRQEPFDQLDCGVLRERAGQCGEEHEPVHVRGIGAVARRRTREFRQALRSAVGQVAPVQVFPVEEIERQARRVVRQRPATGMGVHGDESGHVQRKRQAHLLVIQRIRVPDCRPVLDAVLACEAIPGHLVHQRASPAAMVERAQVLCGHLSRELLGGEFESRPSGVGTSQEENPGRAPPSGA